MGIFFNDALIAVENNGHEIIDCYTFGKKDMAYPNTYLETVVDKITDKETIMGTWFYYKC